MRSIAALALCVIGPALAQGDGLPLPKGSPLDCELRGIVRVDPATRAIGLYGITGLDQPQATDVVQVEPEDQARHLAQFRGFLVTVRGRPVVERGRVVRIRVASVPDPVLRTGLTGRVVRYAIVGNHAPQLGFVVPEHEWTPFVVDVSREVHARLAQGEVVRFDAWVFGDFAEGLLVRIDDQPAPRARTFGESVARATKLELGGTRAVSIGTPKPAAASPSWGVTPDNGPAGDGLEARLSDPQRGAWAVRRLRFPSAAAALAHAEQVAREWDERLGFEPGPRLPTWGLIEAQGAEVVVVETDSGLRATPDLEAMRAAAWAAGAKPQGPLGVRAVASPDSVSALSWQPGQVRNSVVRGLERARGYQAKQDPLAKVETLGPDTLKYESQRVDGQNLIAYLRLEKDQAEMRRSVKKSGASGWVDQAEQVQSGMAQLVGPKR